MRLKNLSPPNFTPMDGGYVYRSGSTWVELDADFDKGVCRIDSFTSHGDGRKTLKVFRQYFSNITVQDVGTLENSLGFWRKMKQEGLVDTLLDEKGNLTEKTIRAPRVPNEVFVDEWDKVYNMHRILSPKGWALIGQGAFGKVYANPQYESWVLKVFADQGYYDYLEATRKTNNPHFPRVGKRYKIMGETDPNSDSLSNGLFACMIEKLAKRPTHSVPLVKYLRRKLPREYIAGRRHHSDFNDPPPKVTPRDQKVIQYMEAKYPKLRDALGDLGEFCAQYLHMNLDLQPRNIMWRGDVPVFVDPVWLDN